MLLQRCCCCCSQVLLLKVFVETVVGKNCWKELLLNIFLVVVIVKVVVERLRLKVSVGSYCRELLPRGWI